MKDALLLTAEWTARQIYWRSPWLRTLAKRRQQQKKPTPQAADRQLLREYLESIGVRQGKLVMAHTSIAGLRLTSDNKADSKAANSIEVAGQLVRDLLELVGDSGTLVMPTHAYYQNDDNPPQNGCQRNPPVYDPTSTPCGVGLANELFWRRKDVQRSQFPYNMLAARGPLAEELLHNNLNDAKPLPHGIHSGYYRFCQKNGLIVGIGLVLGRYLTLSHVAEEIRDTQWPINNFFEEKEYVVVLGNKKRNVIVRQTRPEFMKYSICTRTLRRDLVREGILHEELVGSLRLDWARSKEVFDYIMNRNRNSTYPYFLPSLARRKKRLHD